MKNHFLKNNENNVKSVIDEAKLNSILEKTKNPPMNIISGILKKALRKEGLSLTDVGYLLNAEGESTTEKMYKAAGRIKSDIYGERLVFFAPLYISNFCINNCSYCGFRRENSINPSASDIPASNSAISASNFGKRKKLSLREIEQQTRALIRMGHKRLLLEFGEHPDENPIDYVVDAIKAIYAVKEGRGEIRRLNVNIAATNIEDYRKLKSAGIGTYQLFQETYHRHTYEKLHQGPKADYERQLFAHDRAIKAGIDDVGLGVLYGLFDYKFDTLALVSHSQYLERAYGIGPHTISVPRLQPAQGADLNPEFLNPEFRVSEDELLKSIAILRMAVPYTGMIITTREKPELRAKAFRIGISQTSAASKTSPDGYSESGEHSKCRNISEGGKDRGKDDIECRQVQQFSVSDHRSVEEVLTSALRQGLLPSFCTACYRTGRTGEAIMKLLKSGKIHELCRPNAILTFKEYLEDYASEETKALGLKVINKCIMQISDKSNKEETLKRLERIEGGERDLFF